MASLLAKIQISKIVMILTVCFLIENSNEVKAESIQNATPKDITYLLNAASGRNSAYMALLIGETHDRIYIEYLTAVNANSFFSKKPKRVIFWLLKPDITDEQLALLKKYKEAQINRHVSSESP